MVVISSLLVTLHMYLEIQSDGNNLGLCSLYLHSLKLSHGTGNCILGWGNYQYNLGLYDAQSARPTRAHKPATLSHLTTLRLFAALKITTVARSTQNFNYFEYQVLPVAYSVMRIFFVFSFPYTFLRFIEPIVGFDFIYGVFGLLL